MTTLKVEYARTFAVPGSFTSTRVVGTVEVLVEDEWPREWGVAYAQLKAQMDQAIDLLPSDADTDSSNSSPPSVAEPSADEPSGTPEVSQQATIIPGDHVNFTGCRVMFPPNEYAAKGRKGPHVRLRIGNTEQIPVGTPQGYVNAKSDDPAIMNLLRQYRPGDLLDVEGAFEAPWMRKTKDNGEVEEWDLVVTSISRS